MTSNPETDAKASRLVVINLITSTILNDSLFGTAPSANPCLHTTARRFAEDFFERMNPRDPAEELLVSQMLMAHARVVRLTTLASTASDYDGIRIVNEYADKASNSYRRLMLALTEYRRPPKQGDTITAIGQANFANQQVIQNHETTNATNEQGCKPQAAPALPADAGGIGVSAFNCSASPALDAIHRPTNAQRQESIEHERCETR